MLSVDQANTKTLPFNAKRACDIYILGILLALQKDKHLKASLESSEGGGKQPRRGDQPGVMQGR